MLLNTEVLKFSNLKSVEEMSEALKYVLPKNITNKDIIFFCIGTDRSTGDSYGPLVGTYLETLGYKNVIGNLKNPVHAVNLEEKLQLVGKDKLIIAIDACLGQLSSVETISIKKGSIKPGAGVGKDLPAIGDIAITGIVNISGFMDFFVLQNTRLSIVMEMAKKTARAIFQTIPLNE